MEYLMPKRVVLAYSGGLDTSVAVRWMIDNLGVDVIALAVNVGQDGGSIDETTILTSSNRMAGRVVCGPPRYDRPRPRGVGATDRNFSVSPAS